MFPAADDQVATFVAFLTISTSIFNQIHFVDENIQFETTNYKRTLPDEAFVIVDVFQQLNGYLTKRSQNLSFSTSKSVQGQPGLPQKDESFVFSNTLW
ncbi:unnamed protein product [Auanema sp. JU1783]|nr:unnamed protein product [Auanema sp. JU1783]